jgi:O-acetyl-ADP-ribose deacetylase (regulator of RNase III)
MVAAWRGRSREPAGRTCSASRTNAHPSVSARRWRRSTLTKAEELGARSVALVAFGTGVGGFPLEEAARIMVGAAREHSGALERIVFAVHGEDAERAFREAL